MLLILTFRTNCCKQAANHDDAIEGETGLGAVPSDELLDGEFIDAARTGRREAVEHGHLGMVEVGQS